MSKFTPGPWETLAEDGFTVIGYMPTEPDGAPTMIVIADYSASLPDDVARANTRLIAAAPEMYEALRHALSIGEGGIPPLSETMAVWRSLLAKIDGGSHED